MKTTPINLEIPHAVLRRAKSAPAVRGISLDQFVTEAMKDKLRKETKADDKRWLKLAGKLKHLHKETLRINRLIEEQTEKIDAEIWS